MNQPNPIYMDYGATTPLDPRVLEAMLPYLQHEFGNAASTQHQFGRHAAQAAHQARNDIAQMINGAPLGLIFTSGATESINLALKGLADFYTAKPRNHIVTSQTEHPAVLDCCHWLETKGFQVSYLPVDSQGHLDLDLLDRTVTGRTLAISVMYANHETGVLHDVAAIGAIAKAKGAFFHCDAVQALGKEPLDAEAFGIDLLSFSGHKIYGPKGIGGLWVRRKNPRVRLGAQIHGGGHERGFRSGTLNVPGIVGLARALQLCVDGRNAENQRLSALRRTMLDHLSQANLSFTVNGDMQRRLAGNLNLRFHGIPSAKLLEAVPSLAVSRGSACTSAVPSPSRILLAMGLTADQAQESLRIGLGRMTEASEVTLAAQLLAKGHAAVLAESKSSR